MSCTRLIPNVRSDLQNLRLGAINLLRTWAPVLSVCSRRSQVEQWYATSPLFLDNLHFGHFVKRVNTHIQVEIVDEMSEMEIV